MQHLFSDPQVRHRGMISEVEHPSIDGLRLTGAPIKFSATPTKVSLPPPLLGEHTDEILAELLGRAPQDIEALRQEGVV